MTIGEYLSGGITAQIHYHRFIWKRNQVRRYQVIYTRVMKTATCIRLLVVAFIVVEAAPRGELGGGPRKSFPEGVSWKLEDIETTEHCCNCHRIPLCYELHISCC